MTQLSVAAVAVATCVFLAGCAGTTDRNDTSTWSPDRIYQEARDELEAGNTDKAAVLFEKLEGRAAGTPLAQQAQLERAYMHYKAREQAQALAVIDRFMRLHPASEAYDYALYLRGLVNFNDNLGLFGFLGDQDLSERDQKAAKDSYESFKELTERFPKSKYADDARQRMAYIVNALSQAEVNVARYYVKRGVWLAAINRAQTAIKSYPGAPAQEEALAILAQSYDAMGMKALRDDTLRVLRSNYPQSEFLGNPSARVKNQSPWWKLW